MIRRKNSWIYIIGIILLIAILTNPSQQDFDTKIGRLENMTVVKKSYFLFSKYYSSVSTKGRSYHLNYIGFFNTFLGFV